MSTLVRWADASAVWINRQQFPLLLSALGLLLASAVVVGSMQTRAVFTSVVTNTATFTSGTVAITSGVGHAFLNAVAMLPGEGTTAPLSIANTGTLPFRYGIASTATNPDGKQLARQLELTIKEKVADCTEAGIEHTGNVMYRGPVAATPDGETENPLVGSVQPGLAAVPGDRLLASGANETLCFRVWLPESSGPQFSAASTTVALVFGAKQLIGTP